jgi:hypothetical protein
MKKLFIALLLSAAVLTACNDETPVDNTPSEPTDTRDVVLGDYTCDYQVFNAVTGVQDRKGSFELKVYANSDDDKMFDFRIDGLTRFMSGTNLVKVQDGYSFEIPEQDVDNFGLIKGSPIINVPGQTTRVSGHVKSSNGLITVYCERARKVGQDDDLFEFLMTPK